MVKNVLQGRYLCSFYLDFFLRTDTTYAKQFRTRARLVSKVLPQKFPICLQFWYHMESTDDSSSLRVYIRPTGGKLLKLWEKKGDQGHHWKLGQIEIQSNVNYKVDKDQYKICICVANELLFKDLLQY